MAEKNVKTEVNEDPVIQELRKSISGEAERVSSASTGVEDTISEAVQRTQAAGEAGEQRIDSSFDRQRQQVLGMGEQAVTGFAEARRGFGTQLSALRNLVNTTDEQLKDLDARREEAQLANDVATLNATNALIMEGEKMKMDALQNTFNNMLAVTNMGLQARQFELGQAQQAEQFQLTYELEGEKFQLSKDQQSFAEQQAIGGVALEFGLDVAPGETIGSIIDKAAATGIVDERRALELSQIRADITRSNAETARIMKQNASEKALDPITVESLAKAYRDGNTEFLAGLETNEQYGQVLGKINEMDDLQDNNMAVMAKWYASEKDFMRAVDKWIATTNVSQARKDSMKASAIAAAAKAGFTGDATEDTPFESLPRTAASVSGRVAEFGLDALEWITGVPRFGGEPE
jgi:hypothetical protein